jgi:acyl carrier protein
MACKIMTPLEEKLLSLINIVLTNRGRNAFETLPQKALLRNDFGFDSLDLAELTVRIEAEFDVDIFEDGIVNSFEDVLQKLKKQE